MLSVFELMSRLNDPGAIFDRDEVLALLASNRGYVTQRDTQKSEGVEHVEKTKEQAAQ